MTYGTINDVQTVTGDGKGPIFAGRYRIVRQLGAGGMGSVWLAEDTQLDNKQFAIKMLPAILVANKRAYRQLKDEALVAMRLVHPNIVQIRAFEENNGNPFLVMDYIEGQTLDAYIAEKGTLTEEEVIRVLRPIAAALDYAHGKGVVHRDVKPGNVMIAKDGTPFILDFGIAREIQETMTRVTGKQSSGTLLYMSPEQLRGQPPKAAQDVYSFAAMAYECLKGEPPFSRGDIEYLIINELPEPLPGGPRPVAAAIMAGLAKKPEDRPRDCAGVLECGDFSRAEQLERVEGRAVSMKPQSSPPNRHLGEEDAARARVEAKMRQRRIERLPDEDGFAERKSALADSFVKAEMLFEARLWGDAMREFTEYVQGFDELEKRDEEIREQRRLGPPSGTTETIVLPGLVEMRMRWCRPGTFMMGSSESENGHRGDERQHKVTLTKGFWLGETPVTQRQWWCVMGSRPSSFKGEDLPVESISWDDCQNFIQKINERLNCGARLPTEAEWEFACRAGTTDVYCGMGRFDEIGWCDYSAKLYGLGSKTHSVAQKKPNAWGLYDMIGNVWEWCSDWYGVYPHGSITDPTGPSSGVFRVNRGGDWFDGHSRCRPAFRNYNSPACRDESLGFRVALAPSH